MNIENKIRTEITKAVKTGDTVARDVLRLVLGEMQLVSNGKEITDSLAQTVIKKTVKSNNETLKLAEKEETQAALKKEISVLEQFLPQTMTEEESRIFINSLSLDFSNAKSVGQKIGMIFKSGVYKNLNKTIDAGILNKILSE